MKAIGFYHALPILDDDSLLNVTIDKPVASNRDILVKVKAISVNPVDTKIRKTSKLDEQLKVIGYDAAGIVESVGAECTLLKPGDEVYYAGDVTRAGTNSEFHLVDERIVGIKPAALSFEEAAALPLTTITAYEAMCERMHISLNREGETAAILIIGAAGGVGSIAIQLAKWKGLKVIATASRPETIDWVTELGADHVVNHRESIPEQLKRIGYDQVPYIFCLHSTAAHWDTLVQLIEPEGTICSIVDTEKPVDLNSLKDKSVTFVWEFMFTRPKHKTNTLTRQRDCLNVVSSLIDQGKIKTTAKQILSPINAYNLKKAHEAVESGKTIGKIVLKDFE